MMNEKDTVERGNRFFFLFVSVWLFVHLGIIVPSQEPSELNKLIADVKSFNKDHQEVLLNFLEEFPGHTRLEKQEAYKERTDTVEKLLALKAKLVELERENQQDSKFTLPFVGVGINGTTTAILYPAFSTIGLLTMLWFRNQYLEVVPKPYKSPPIWVLPLPLKSVDMDFWRWIFWNMLGLLWPMLVCYVVAVFLFWTWQQHLALLEIMTVQWTLGIITVASYLFIIFGCLRVDYRS